MFTRLHSLINFFTRVRHSCTARSKSADTRIFGGVAFGVFVEGGAVNGRILVALLNLGAENRDQILLIDSWGGNGFFFFFGFI